LAERKIPIINPITPHAGIRHRMHVVELYAKVIRELSSLHEGSGGLNRVPIFGGQSGRFGPPLEGLPEATEIELRARDNAAIQDSTMHGT